APKSAAAIRYAAAAARHSLLAEVRTTLPALEALYLEDLMNTSDAVEGIQAFLDKRPPRWSDR
nr:cyclohexa-1,5-dienecarbonyl-CoA hydratase [Acidobacteriota bacterium]